MGLGVNHKVKDRFLVEVGTLSRDLGEGSVDSFENLLVELLTVGSLVETGEGPGVTEDPKLLEEIELDLNTSAGEGLEASCEQVDHHGSLDDLWRVHRGMEVLLHEVVDGLLGWVVRVGVVEGLVLEVLGEQLVNPLVLIGGAGRLGRVFLGAVTDPGVEERLPVEIGVGDEDDTVTGDGSGGGIPEVLDLEGHLCSVEHGNTLGISEGEDLVIVEHRVEVLDPNGIDGTIAANPVVHFVRLGVLSLPDFGENTGFPLSNIVHHTEHLLAGDGLRVHLGDHVLGVVRHG